MVAKSQREVAMRYDTYANLIAQSPKAEHADQSKEAAENARPQPLGDLFEVSVEFDLHSVMAQTYLSMRPVRPKAVLRQYK